MLSPRHLVIGGSSLGFTFQIALWLWFTVLFANFAEAIAEGRGKAQADALRKTRTETQAKLLTGSGRDYKLIPGTSLKVGDVVLVEPGDTIPSDGEIVEGMASVNEAAITGGLPAAMPPSAVGPSPLHPSGHPRPRTDGAAGTATGTGTRTATGRDPFEGDGALAGAPGATRAEHGGHRSRPNQPAAHPHFCADPAAPTSSL